MEVVFLNSIRFELRLSSELSDKLDQIAADNGVTRSAAVKMLIARYEICKEGGLTTTAPLERSMINDQK